MSDLEEPPATAFELVLESCDRDIAWGLLLCGLELRLYRRGTGISQQYLAMDLDGLVELNDEDFWRAFAGLFRLPAARPDADGIPLIQRVMRRKPARTRRDSPTTCAAMSSTPPKRSYREPSTRRAIASGSAAVRRLTPARPLSGVALRPISPPVRAVRGVARRHANELRRSLRHDVLTRSPRRAGPPRRRASARRHVHR